ncbi:MAG: TlpA family protein disulfide reductase [Planctomycetaceae bacterium]|jgi:thiol-disulfide isomerase/thioredoxin|nr:TlpA family protein disulfide reductase [Planctomycetaceae bacterium]
MNLLFLLLTCFALDAEWTPDTVPSKSPDEFLYYYQRFLHVNPFPINQNPKNDEEKWKNAMNHHQSALLYAKMSEAAESLTRSDTLPAAAPKELKKDKSNKIHGTWNLYKNIPVNAADLWAESCFLKYQSLAHESDLNPDKIAMLHEFATEIEQYAVLTPLFLSLKRNACLRSLNFVRKPMKDREENPSQKTETMPAAPELGEKLVAVNILFAEFLKKFPNEDNMKTAEVFLDTIRLFRSYFPDSNRLSDAVEPLRRVFIDVQKRISDPLIREYAEVYEGMLRRQELLGKTMPIWGADLNGKMLDAASLEGKVVLLDFWATWCGPCVGEFPHLKKLYEKYHGKGFEIIGFNVDSDSKKLTAYLERNPLPWRTLSKEATKQAGLPSLSGYYGAKQIPVVLLRNRAGNAVLLDARGEKLDEILENIFGE